MAAHAEADTVQKPKVASTGMLKLAKDIFAGTCGGIAVTAVGHPFDTIKVRLQTQPMDKPIYGELATTYAKQQMPYHPTWLQRTPGPPLSCSYAAMFCSGRGGLCKEDHSMGGLARVVQGVQ
eukprot:GHUV01055314.1.p1 GENE.GHUV01055314.1~~GHUV01055314.1.p1  ORF type:complete len:122 (+),score=22.98 GHUV01055314.1:426-791(+)